jgi:hypothetical protein
MKGDEDGGWRIVNRKGRRKSSNEKEKSYGGDSEFS